MFRRSAADLVDRANIVVEPPDEILANKLTALVGRAEERDLSDVNFPGRAGSTVEAAPPEALALGWTAAARRRPVTWLLSEIAIPDGIAPRRALSPPSGEHA